MLLLLLLHNYHGAKLGNFPDMTNDLYENQQLMKRNRHFLPLLKGKGSTKHDNVCTI